MDTLSGPAGCVLCHEQSRPSLHAERLQLCWSCCAAVSSQGAKYCIDGRSGAGTHPSLAICSCHLARSAGCLRREGLKGLECCAWAVTTADPCVYLLVVVRLWLCFLCLISILSAAISMNCSRYSVFLARELPACGAYPRVVTPSA